MTFPLARRNLVIRINKRHTLPIKFVVAVERGLFYYSTVFPSWIIYIKSSSPESEFRYHFTLPMKLREKDEESRRSMVIVLPHISALKLPLLNQRARNPAQ